MYLLIGGVVGRYGEEDWGLWFMFMGYLFEELL